MNILHHKSWHVYNKANIEKVKRDEAEAEAEAKKKQDRVKLAESEVRLQLLRKKAEANLPHEQVNQIEKTKTAQRVNLFEDLEQKNDKSTNEEYEAEKKAKEDKLERQFTMYLDKGATKEEEPWYSKKDNKDKYIDQYVFKSRKTEESKKHHRRSKLDFSEDPLDFISKTLKKRDEKRKEKEKGSSHYRDDERRRSHSDKYRKEDKQSKKSSKSSGPTMEELRAKRLERERGEKARLREIFVDHSNEKEDRDLDLNERKRGYNSQYNREETMMAKEYSHKRVKRSGI